MRRSRAKTKDLFGECETAPGIGGLDVTSPHSKFLLPVEVVLYEPSPAEIHRGGKPAPRGRPGTRLIFLNTPLTEVEQEGLRKIHEALEQEDVVTKAGDGSIPVYVSLHALRILQQTKFDTQRCLEIMLAHLELRVKNLPVAQDQVMADLQRGCMYWHGRDRKCRPCLIWRMERMDFSDLDRAVKLCLFVLEYGVRYALVPGRVENWILIVDLTGIGVSHCTNNFRIVAGQIKRLLEEVYCGRNYGTKILYAPYLVKRIANGFIPADKKEKVQFVGPEDRESVLLEMFQPNQLEKQYGGTAPDLAPEQTFPFKFFENCTGKDADGCGHDSVHELTNRVFHEGTLWDESSPALKAKWQPLAAQQSLTSVAASALNPQVEPCRTLDQWLGLVNPKAAGKSKAGQDAQDIKVDARPISDEVENTAVVEDMFGRAVVPEVAKSAPVEEVPDGDRVDVANPLDVAIGKAGVSEEPTDTQQNGVEPANAKDKDSARVRGQNIVTSPTEVETKFVDEAENASYVITGSGVGVLQEGEADSQCGSRCFCRPW